MKILFLATYPDQPIGYGRIGHQLSHYLVEAGHDVVYFGFSNFTTTKIQRKSDTRIKIIDVVEEEKNLGFQEEHFGVHLINDVLLKEKPDVLFIYNDIVVVCRMFNEILSIFPDKNNRPFKTITYLDLVYPFEKKKYLKHVMTHSNKIILFSKYWLNHIEEQLKWDYTTFENVVKPSLGYLYHSVRSGSFFLLDERNARQALHFDPDGFYFLNLNRNSYRKAPDLSVRSFLLFLKWSGMDKKIYLIMQCMLDAPSGYNLSNLIETECQILGFSKDDTSCVMTHHIRSIPSYQIEDDTINLLYNACQVGLNSCVGEGFGLTNVEHGWLGKPQIVSSVGSLTEIFRDSPIPPIKPVVDVQICKLLDDHEGLISFIDPIEMANLMKKVYMNYSFYHQRAIEFSQSVLHPTFNETTIRKKFLSDITF